LSSCLHSVWRPCLSSGQRQWQCWSLQERSEKTKLWQQRTLDCMRAERRFAFMSAKLTWKNRENLSTFIQIVLSLPKILLKIGQLTPGRKRLHYTNFRVFRQCLPRDVFILMSHYLKSVNYIDCRWWALYLPLSQTQGQQMKSERDNLRKKLFRPTVLVTLRWDTLCSTHIATKSCAPYLPVLNFTLLWCDANLHAATFMHEISDRRFKPIKPTTRLRVDIAHEDNGTEEVLKVNKELVISFHCTKCTLWLRTENKMKLFLGCIHYVHWRGDGGGGRGYFLKRQNISISPRHHTEFFDIPSLTKRKNDTPSLSFRKVKYGQYDEMVQRLMFKIEN